MRRVRRKGGHKEKVFGCDLLEHLSASSQEIPLVLRCCSEFVETHGIVDGIYRLSGVSSNIQKLRGEFEGDGAPDLNKDLYLQDIHCVSSLCKAYFRELPNPLLTYQLYDKFAEAVAIQLEEERLVKIRDVLKELPAPHYKTLEFLMRHLVRMASYSSETNMHARNLAIVWAPNLLRSKDIEVSGFNGTAAFMEVRVQSIVVEFILTHVAQLFPGLDLSNERRNSLPSPTAASCGEEVFLKSASLQPFPNFGNISPGDGPLPIRPYHAIIEGTDKRKGSLKGRKWMSIFNIGGRFHDPRRRHKHSAKEKDRPILRPARSMDSLSTSPCPKEVSRRPAQHPPSTISPLVTSSPQPGSDVSVSTTGIGCSEYAVTYRRGTGLVSGSGGTQGTYTALDPEGLGVTGSETLQTRSPGLSTKVGRRAAMHITGPTMVTVPLHITSTLALGVLQGGGADRVIQRGREKDGGDRVEGTEGRDRKESIVKERKVEEGRVEGTEGRDRKESIVKERKVEEGRVEGTEGRDRKESIVKRRKVEEGRAAERKEMNHRRTVTDGEQVVDDNVHEEAGVDEGAEGKGIKGEEKEEEEEVRGDSRKEPEMVIRNRKVSREQRVKSLTSNTMEDEYMDMRDVIEVTQPVDVFEASDILNSTEVETDDLGLSGYVQDNFEFLDQMDHMDYGFTSQVNEFSVEPPGDSDDEYEVMEQYHSSNHLAEEHTHQQPSPETHTRSPTESNTHRPLSMDSHSRHAKSLSLPYRASAVIGAEESSSEEEADDDSSDEDEGMFVKSLPCEYFLNNLPEFEAYSTDRCALDGVAVHQLQISEERDSPSPNLESPPHYESSEEEQENEDVKDKEENAGLEVRDSTEKEEELHQRRDVLENKRQSEATEADPSVVEETQSEEEQSLTLDSASPLACPECPTPSSEESSNVADVKVEEKRESVDDPQTEYPACCAIFKQEESSDFPFKDFSVCVIEEPRFHVRGDDDEDDDEDRVSKDDLSQETVEGIKESDDNTKEETIMGGYEEDSKEEESAILYELDDVEEDGGITECVVESVVGEEEEGEQREDTSGEKNDEERGTTETEVRIEKGAAEEKLPDPEEQQVCEQKETDVPNATELDEAIQKKCAKSKEATQNDREEVVSKEREKENHDKKRGDVQQIRIKSIDNELIEVKSGIGKAMKHEGSDGVKGGVGRKLVVSKQPKFYQVKAVPVVPPKPQHCKITALTLKHQQQQRERRDADRGRENALKVQTEGDHVCAGGQKKDGDDESEGEGKKEQQPEQRGGERERERRRDLDESLTRDSNRNSPLSMNFEEAVAIITMKREKEKEDDKEKERQKDWGNEVE
ncbi:rho GTPase-activating protein 30 [Labrus mixtus]|nr:rho GTPase-activating protein 30 [Labrus mixtus]XP_060901339.1 rho GTPase-activating protein 30 [Labrus mixtus]